MSPSESNENDLQQEKSWKLWLQDLLTVHFIIAVLILVFWIYALNKPLTALADIYGKIEEIKDLELYSQAITKITGSTVTISGIFTTVLGLVLGHFFGQKGQAAAEEARDSALQRKQQTVKDLEESADVADDGIEELTESLALRNKALEQLITLLPEGTEVDEDSPFGKLLSQNDSENNDASDEG